MSRQPTAQGSGTSPSEAERLRRARLSVWEYEGGGLGPLRPPPGQRTEVVFDGVTLPTAPGVVMTPRHTTEALVDWAVEWIGSRSVRVADVGTGSGAVAIAVALRAPHARIWATDDSESAVTLHAQTSRGSAWNRECVCWSATCSSRCAASSTSCSRTCGAAAASAAGEHQRSTRQRSSVLEALAGEALEGTA